MVKVGEDLWHTTDMMQADGRLLHVYYKDGSISKQGTRAPPKSDMVQTVLDDHIIIDIADPIETMEVDELAEAREEQDKLREERRGKEERAPREVFPVAPRSDRREDDYYNRGPRRVEPEYQQDGRYGYGGDDRFRGGRGGGGGRYGGPPPRMYSDGMRRGGRGQSYRP